MQEPQLEQAKKLAILIARTYLKPSLGCAKCHSTISLCMHHPNYDNPLQIITLCAPCHNKLHKSKSEIGFQTSDWKNYDAVLEGYTEIPREKPRFNRLGFKDPRATTSFSLRKHEFSALPKRHAGGVVS